MSRGLIDRLDFGIDDQDQGIAVFPDFVARVTDDVSTEQCERTHGWCQSAARQMAEMATAIVAESRSMDSPG